MNGKESEDDKREQDLKDGQGQVADISSEAKQGEASDLKNEDEGKKDESEQVKREISFKSPEHETRKSAGKLESSPTVTKSQSDKDPRSHVDQDHKHDARPHYHYNKASHHDLNRADSHKSHSSIDDDSPKATATGGTEPHIVNSMSMESGMLSAARMESANRRASFHKYLSYDLDGQGMPASSKNIFSSRHVIRAQLTEALKNQDTVNDDGFLIDDATFRKEFEAQFKNELHQVLDLYSKKHVEFLLTTSEQPEISLRAMIPYLMEGVEDITEDDFNKCFQSRRIKAWNWTIYMYPAWLVGVFVRYCILFPARLLSLIAASIFVFVGIFLIKLFVKDPTRRMEIEGNLLKLYAQAWVMSWSGVVKYHGSRPRSGANQVFVANHTSMIDYILLLCVHPFAVVGQLHPGVVGYLQTNLLSALGCIWFDRQAIQDRIAVRNRIQSHVTRGDVPPLLIFPEGTCVNNEYCVMFKKGAFELGVDVHPVAIKYNKLFADAFWNSRQESFFFHIFRLMKSWCVIADVWFLPPQRIQPNETPEDFAKRVKIMIEMRTGLKDMPYDGYLKHMKPSDRYKESRQVQIAEWFRQELEDYKCSKESNDTYRTMVQRRAQRKVVLEAFHEQQQPGAMGLNI